MVLWCLMGILGQLHPADLCVQCLGSPAHPRVTYSSSPSKKRDWQCLRRCNLCCQILTVVSKFLTATCSLMWLTWQSSLCFIWGKILCYMQILKSLLNGASFVVLNVQTVWCEALGKASRSPSIRCNGKWWGFSQTLIPVRAAATSLTRSCKNSVSCCTISTMA